jgi:hypothetical protein
MKALLYKKMCVLNGDEIEIEIENEIFSLKDPKSVKGHRLLDCLFALLGLLA